jgi:hypothetical protein
MEVAVAGRSLQLAVYSLQSPEQLPRRGNIIVENKANKEKAPELPDKISVTIVSFGGKLQTRQQAESKKVKSIERRTERRI